MNKLVSTYIFKSTGNGMVTFRFDCVFRISKLKIVCCLKSFDFIEKLNCLKIIQSFCTLCYINCKKGFTLRLLSFFIGFIVIYNFDYEKTTTIVFYFLYRVTYQRLMWRYCQEGDVDGATKVLEKMRELNMPVSEPVLNALIMGHAFHGDTDGAKAVLDTMSGAGLKPSNRTYALLACGYAKQGDIDNVEKIINAAKEQDNHLNDKVSITFLFIKVK